MNPITNFEKWINSIATGDAPDIAPVTRIEHFLNKIRQAIARKSDALPEVTEDDNGKVPTVIDGEWGLSVPSGGGGLVVTGSMLVNSVSTLDKTYAEIEAAILAATPVTVIVNTASSQEYNRQYVSNNLAVYLYDGVYYVVVNVGTETQYTYVCDDKTKYPSMGFD